MTERKPRGMSFETWVDSQISRAQAQGAFEGLPGYARLSGGAAFNEFDVL